MIKICRVDGCEKIRHTKSTLCAMHRTRWKKYRSFELPKKPDLPIGIYYNCKFHGNLKKIECITNHRIGRNNLQVRCKECYKISRKKSNIKNIERVRRVDREHYAKTRKRHLELIRLRKFGITEEKYQQMLKSQNYICAICKNPEKSIFKKTKELKQLSVDHCHKTLKIRGLLCSACNTAFGLLKENISIMLSMIQYKKAHP